MKEPWDKLCNHIFDLKETLVEHISVLPKSAVFNTSEKKIRKHLHHINQYAKEVDRYMSPINPVTIKPIFNHDQFIETWEYWKDYLIEQHGIHMKSRMERSALKRLFDLSNKDPVQAIKFIENSVAGGYKNIFPDANPKNGKTKTENYDPDFN